MARKTTEHSSILGGQFAVENLGQFAVEKKGLIDMELVGQYARNIHLEVLQ